MKCAIAQQSHIGRRPSNEDRLGHWRSAQALLLAAADAERFSEVLRRFGRYTKFYMDAWAETSAPVIIHLLNRQRYRRITWAAMHWLLASFKKSSRRLQIEDLILLIIRILILVLLIRPQGILRGKGD